MALNTLVNRIGSLAEAFLQLDPLTIQHSAQITTDRKKDDDSAIESFWTADSALYAVENGEAILYLGKGVGFNPVFNHLVEAIEQLTGNGNYQPGKEDIESVIKARSTLRVRLSELELKESNDEISYFEIDTAYYNITLNSEQRKVAERVYGQGNNFEENMAMLNRNGIDKTRIRVLNPEYVKGDVKEGGAIARVCCLYGFESDSHFYATGNDVVHSYMAMRGLSRNLHDVQGDMNRDGNVRSSKLTPPQTYFLQVIQNPEVAGPPVRIPTSIERRLSEIPEAYVKQN